MKLVRDRTGRLYLRPHFESGELDSECEAVITAFLRERYSNVRFPLSTDDLQIFMEPSISTFDLYADLSSEGSDVQGLTVFEAGNKPHVYIARELSSAAYREKRLRTTLAHEFGHVHFHNILFQHGPGALQLFDTPAMRQSCKRSGLLNAGTSDWMEWQAGYVCGALLMPLTYLHHTARESPQWAGIPLGPDSAEAVELARIVALQFFVSEDAARVRLSRLGYIAASPNLQRLV